MKPFMTVRVCYNSNYSVVSALQIKAAPYQGSSRDAALQAVGVDLWRALEAFHANEYTDAILQQLRAGLTNNKNENLHSLMSRVGDKNTNTSCRSREEAGIDLPTLRICRDSRTGCGWLESSKLVFEHLGLVMSEPGKRYLHRCDTKRGRGRTRAQKPAVMHQRRIRKVIKRDEAHVTKKLHTHLRAEGLRSRTVFSNHEIMQKEDAKVKGKEDALAAAQQSGNTAAIQKAQVALRYAIGARDKKRAKLPATGLEDADDIADSAAAPSAVVYQGKGRAMQGRGTRRLQPEDFAVSDDGASTSADASRQSSKAPAKRAAPVQPTQAAPMRASKRARTEVCYAEDLSSD